MAKYGEDQSIKGLEVEHVQHGRWLGTFSGENGEKLAVVRDDNKKHGGKRSEGASVREIAEFPWHRELVEGYGHPNPD